MLYLERFVSYLLGFIAVGALVFSVLQDKKVREILGDKSFWFFAVFAAIVTIFLDIVWK